MALFDMLKKQAAEAAKADFSEELEQGLKMLVSEE